MASYAGAQSLQQIVRKHKAAHQQEFWDQINTISADIIWHGDRGDLTADFLAKKPDLVKIISAEHRFIEAFDGIESWTLASWTDEEIENLSDSRSWIIRSLVPFGSPIQTEEGLTLKGRVEVDNIPCYWLEIKDPESQVEHFIDARTLLMYKSIITRQVEDNSITITRTVRKYRALNGIQFPTVVYIRTLSDASEYVFENIVLGEGIPTSKFMKPDEL